MPVSYSAGTYRVGEFELPRIDVIAAKTAQGKIAVAITNVDAGRPATVDVELKELSSGRAEGETLAAPKVDSINTFDNPKVVAPKAVTAAIRKGRLTLTVPPASVTVVTTQ